MGNGYHEQAEAANWEMLELLADFLPKRFPDRFTKEGDILVNHSTGDVWDLADKDQDPLEVSALLVQVSHQFALSPVMYLGSQDVCFPAARNFRR
jgi:hypothetical protein